MMLINLVGVCETTHAAHDTEHIVVGGENLDRFSAGGAGGIYA